jgi:CheY-like chemotaxis protein
MANRVLLYVEDEDSAVFLFETALKEADIKVDFYRVSDGDQALSFLQRLGAYEKAPRPGLVLLDLNLPRKSGLEVLAEIQHSDALRPIPVIVFTSSSLSSDRERSLALGAQHYITKPSTFDALIDAVKTACSYLPERVNRVNKEGSR